MSDAAKVAIAAIAAVTLISMTYFMLRDTTPEQRAGILRAGAKYVLAFRGQ